MSIDTMQRVWEHSEQSGSILVALLALADRSDADGYCWPSIDDIAARTRVNARQAQRIVKALEEAGELYVDRGAGRGRTSSYLVTVGLAADQIARALVHRFDMDPAEAVKTAADLTTEKGDTIGETVTKKTPFGNQKGDILGKKVTSGTPFQEPQKGDILGKKVTSEVKKVTSEVIKGDIAMSPEPSVTIIEPSLDEPSGSATANDDDDERRTVRALSAELQRHGVGVTQYMIDQYMVDVADYGLEAVLRGLQAAADQGKQHKLRYVQKCIVTAAQGDERRADPAHLGTTEDRRRDYMPEQYAEIYANGSSDDAFATEPGPVPEAQPQQHMDAAMAWAQILDELVPPEIYQPAAAATLTNGDGYTLTLPAEYAHQLGNVKRALNSLRVGRDAQRLEDLLAAKTGTWQPVRFKAEEN